MPSRHLGRRINKAVAGELPPIFDPDRAEAASAIVDEDRFHKTREEYTFFAANYANYAKESRS